MEIDQPRKEGEPPQHACGKEQQHDLCVPLRTHGPSGQPYGDGTKEVGESVVVERRDHRRKEQAERRCGKSRPTSRPGQKSRVHEGDGADGCHTLKQAEPQQAPRAEPLLPQPACKPREVVQVVVGQEFWLRKEILVVSLAKSGIDVVDALHTQAKAVEQCQQKDKEGCVTFHLAEILFLFHSIPSRVMTFPSISWKRSLNSSRVRFQRLCDHSQSSG